MKAMVQDRYGSGDVVESRDIDKPSIGADQVLIRVRAAGVNPADWAIMHGLPYIARPIYGLRRPKHGIRGTDVAGQVEAVGSQVTVHEDETHLRRGVVARVELVLGYRAPARILVWAELEQEPA